MKTWLKLFSIDVFTNEASAHISNLTKASSDMLFRGYLRSAIRFAELQSSMVMTQ